MIGSMFNLSDSLRSLLIVSWRRADYHAHALAGGLRLGLTLCRPFLKRAECTVLRARLVRLEMLTRRLLVLMVLEQPLPVIAVRPSGQGRDKSRKPARPARRLFFTRPVFRLSDPSRVPARPRHRRQSVPLPCVHACFISTSPCRRRSPANIRLIRTISFPPRPSCAALSPYAMSMTIPPAILPV